MQNYISHLIITSTQMRLHVLTQLSKTLKNVELKTLYACVCNSSLFKCIIIYCLYKRVQHFRSIGVLKLKPWIMIKMKILIMKAKVWL